MIQRVYIDTSVVGGIYDEGFDVFTRMFFDKAFRGEKPAERTVATLPWRL